MKWRRKLEVDGVWWAQARDGSWSRWDHARTDWVAVLDGPPGGATPLEADGSGVYEPPRSTSVDGTVLWDFVKTFTAIAMPAFFGLLAGWVLIAVFAVIWNGFFVPWLGSPVESVDPLLSVTAGTTAFAFFLAVGTTLMRVDNRVGMLIVAGLIVFGGTAGALAVVAAVRGITLPDLVTRAETILGALVVAASWGGLALRRWMAED
jgi:hypothetical protein